MKCVFRVTGHGSEVKGQTVFGPEGKRGDAEDAEMSTQNQKNRPCADSDGTAELWSDCSQVLKVYSSQQIGASLCR